MKKKATFGSDLAVLEARPTLRMRNSMRFPR